MTRLIPRGPTLALLLTALAAAPAGADWLVMVDGTRVETDGPWNQRGKVVVFTDTSGQLVSLRLADVDLEASREATAAAEVAARQPPVPAQPVSPPRQSVMRLTDEDVGHVDDYDPTAEPEGEPGATAEGSDAAEGEDSPASASAVQVAAWERDETPGGDGILIRATLENPSRDAAVGLSVDVTLYDDEGEILATAPGRLAAAGLMPGQRTELVATFPGLFDFTAVDFDIDHRALRARPADQAPSTESADDLDQDLDAEAAVDQLEQFDESG
ncbi:MAG: hypothetical protein R3244_13665 [Thermoanaerobaculia bacterium]|nr:hypothetical protein [Thermoanaerobaculia bacterium]